MNDQNNMNDTKEMAKLLGRKGGLKTLENMGKKHYRDMAKRSWEKRKGTVNKSVSINKQES